MLHIVIMDGRPMSHRSATIRRVQSSSTTMVEVLTASGGRRTLLPPRTPDPAFSGECDVHDAEATFNRQDGHATIVGEIDMGNADQLQRMLADDVDDIVIDCARLTFVDSSGIAVLAVESRRRELAGRRLRVRNVQPNVQRVLEIAGMLDELT